MFPFSFQQILFIFSEVKLNDSIVSEGAPNSLVNVNNPAVIVGQCVQVCISGANSLPWQLNDVCLSLHFFQDYQNGICNFTMDTHLAMAGPDQLYLPAVSIRLDNKLEVTCFQQIVLFGCIYSLEINICKNRVFFFPKDFYFQY